MKKTLNINNKPKFNFSFNNSDIAYPSFAKNDSFSLKLKNNTFSNGNKGKWNISNFNKKNLPKYIGSIKNKDLFSKRNPNSYIWSLNMPIKMPHSEVKIPKLYNQFSEFLGRVFRNEIKTNPYYDKFYAYLTIDQRKVRPFTSQRRSDWHSDSVRNIKTDNTYDESIYICYDNLPTVFTDAKLDFNKLPTLKSNRILSDFINKSCTQSDHFLHDNYSILHFDPYSLHRENINNDSVNINRTYVKVTFSKDQYNIEGNCHNYYFNYEWDSFPRTLERNNQSYSLDRKNKDCLIFDENTLSYYFNDGITHTPINDNINCANLEQIHNYVGSKTYNAHKKGEYVVDVYDINPTFKIYEIINNSEEKYYLTNDIFNSIYEQNTSNVFTPKSTYINKVKVKNVLKPAIIMTPWGELQHVSPGDYVMMRKNYINVIEYYGISKFAFLKNYDIINEKETKNNTIFV